MSDKKESDSPKLKNPDSSLKKDLSLGLLIFYGVGTILGLGIYVLIGKIAGESQMLAPFAILIAGILAGFTGISYGELSARIPKSAGEVNYVQTAFGKVTLSALVGWLIVFSAMVSTATVVNGYVGYVQVFLDWPSWLIISAITILLGGVAVWGIKESAWIIVVITLIELSGIVIIIIVGGHHLEALPDRWTELLPSFTTGEWQAVAAGAFLAFFAFIGFEDMVNVSEEAKNPQRDMPRAIIVSLITLTVLYVLVAVIAGFALEPQVLDKSDAPLADVVASEGDIYPKMISLISLIAIVNGVLVQIIMCARVLYGMADIKMAPKILGKVNPRTRTPIWGTLFTVIVILALALNFELEGLAKATSYILLTVFITVNLSLFVIKRKDPHPVGVRTYPIWIPVLGFLFSLILIVLEIITSVSEL